MVGNGWARESGTGAGALEPEIREFTQEPPVLRLRVLNNLQFDALKMVVDLSDQRAWLYSGDEVAIETPVSTGSPGFATPLGEFEIRFMSSRFYDPDYGQFVHPGTGQVLMDHVNRKYDYAPSGTVFRAQPKALFMQFDADRGFGFLAGELPGYPSTQGDVLLPPEIATIIYGSLRKGVPVEVRY